MGGRGAATAGLGEKVRLPCAHTRSGAGCGALSAGFSLSRGSQGLTRLGLAVSLRSVYRTKNLAKFGCRSHAQPHRLLWEQARGAILASSGPSKTQLKQN